jgi:hypothetical protein
MKALGSAVSSASKGDVAPDSIQTPPAATPPHLRRASISSDSSDDFDKGHVTMHRQSQDGDAKSTAQSTSDVAYLPPHLRDPSTVSTATTVLEQLDEQQARSMRTFNSFAPDGSRHLVAKAVTIQSGRSFTMEDDDTNQKRGPQPTSTTQGRKGAFAKASEAMLPPVPVRLPYHKKITYVIDHDSDSD